MTFEEKIKLAVEMTNARMEYGSTSSGELAELVRENLSVAASLDTERNLYAQVVRSMFYLIEELQEKEQG